MSVFAAYSKYYDLLYRDKDYSAEADYVMQQLRRFGDNVQTVLELGCGTGAHASLLAARGFSVHGIDMSEGMLAAAEARRNASSDESAASMTFTLGDVRTARLGRTFDAVISLFHVFSYQTTDDDLNAAFATARAHLRPGGVLLFDCWYGPAVLAIGPSTMVKRLEDESVTVTRIAEPLMDVNANTVTVNYDVIVSDKSDNAVHRLTESHRMRYLFSLEIERMCAAHGLDLIAGLEWMGQRPPTSATWAACFLLRG